MIEWSVAARAIPGEDVSGDAHVVKATARGALLAVIDGLGHGFHAAVAARKASESIERWAEEPLQRQVARCHEALAATRGVVLGIASVDAVAGRMEWIGVGNVEGSLVRRSPPNESMVSRAGVVGIRLPTLHVTTHAIAPGDTLAMATDGIRADFGKEVSTIATTEGIAQGILKAYGKDTDDALVLVARYLGAGNADRRE